MDLVETRRLYGRGIGWVDVHLLASAIVAHALVWTRDRRLRTIAASLKVAASDA